MVENKGYLIPSRKKLKPESLSDSQAFSLSLIQPLQLLEIKVFLLVSNGFY